MLRPLVHVLHLLRVVLALVRTAGAVLTTDPLTSRGRRVLLGLAARVTGRRLHVVLLDATVAEAVSGQNRRGRSLGRRRMELHARRWPALRTGTCAASRPSSAGSIRPGA